jgi:hypothetical protein
VDVDDWLTVRTESAKPLLVIVPAALLRLETVGLVIDRQVRLVRQITLLVGRTLAKALVHVRPGQAFLGLALAHAEPGDGLERLPICTTRYS